MDRDEAGVDITPETIHRTSSESSQWDMFGKELPKSEITFFAQVIMVYIVIVVCIVNLSIANGDSNLWTALLSSCLGYLLPSPSMSYNNKPKNAVL